MSKEKPFSVRAPNLYFGIVFCLSGLAYWGADSGFPHLGTQISADKYPFFHVLLTYHLPSLKHIALIIAYISGGFLILKGILGGVWQTYFYVPFDEFKKEIKKILEKQNAPSQLSECTTTSDFESYIDQASKGKYGPHINKDTSFYIFVKEKLMDPFCNEPYKSELKKHVKVTDHTQNDEYINWEEKTEWNVIDPIIEEKKRTGVFDLLYTTSSYAPDMDISNWSEAISLLIRVDNKRILKVDDKPEQKLDLENEGFYCWKDGEWITLRFYKRIVLDAQVTPIYIEEKTINNRDDKTYYYNTSNPIYGSTLEIELPGNYGILEDIYVSSEVLWKGLPDFAKKNLTKDKVLEIKRYADNHIFIDMKGWIMPGIIMTANWIEIP